MRTILSHPSRLLSLPVFPLQGKEKCDENQVYQEIINDVMMDKNVLFWLGNHLICSGGLQVVTNTGGRRRDINHIKKEHLERR